MLEKRVVKREAGFSMIELMVALTVTLIVSGAVFKMMTSSQTAFRKEPEAADRQQAIRVAMDRIWNDAFMAGGGMTPFSQVFDLARDGVGSMGAMGTNTDEIGLTRMGDCPPLTVCDGENGASVTTMQAIPACYDLPALVILGTSKANPGGKTSGVFWAEMPGGGNNASCKAGGPGARNGHVVFPPGKGGGYNPPGGKFGFVPEYMTIASVVYYRISAEADGTPGLWRCPRGRSATATDWELIARGVEDLQVQYYSSGTQWTDQPPIANGTAATVISRVRITLSSRSNAVDLQGGTTSAVGTALRGRLTSEVVPRAALTALGQGSGDF